MKSRLKFWPLPVLLLGALGWFVGSRQDEVSTVSFLAVGQGDCTVFTTKGYTILIDDGPATPYENAGQRIVLPWLQQQGYQSVDAVFLSHPDEDHVGGTPAILAKFTGAELVVSDQFENDPEMLKRLKSWNLDPSAVTWLPKFSNLQMGDAHFEIECPDRPPGSDTNDGSMFIRISEGKGSVVLSGDASKAVERKVENDESWRSEIIHVGHHGSHTATDQSWLEAVDPKYAIISVGRNNRYGHPSRETLQRLADDHIQTYRTDQDGTITFRFDGTTFIKE